MAIAAIFHVDLKHYEPQIENAVEQSGEAAVVVAGVIGAIGGAIKDQSTKASNAAQPGASASTASATPPPIKRSVLLPCLALAPLLLVLSGCAGSTVQPGDVVTAVATDVANGLVVAADVNTAAQAVYAADNGQPLDGATVLKSALAAQSSANTSGLTQAVQTLVNSANAQIASLKAQGASPAATVPAVANSTAAAQVAAYAVAPSPPAAPAAPAAPPSSGGLWHPAGSPLVTLSF